jgi:hypothetical protein
MGVCVKGCLCVCWCVVGDAPMRRSGTFFCVTTATLSLPRTATDVRPSLYAALKAYSICAGERPASFRQPRLVRVGSGGPSQQAPRERAPATAEGRGWLYKVGSISLDVRVYTYVRV